MDRSLAFVAPRRQMPAPVNPAALSRELGFPVRMLGRSDARIFPQQVGRWWMEPLRDYSALPPRARQRLEALLSTGFVAQGIVVFHEIPSAPAGRATAGTARVHHLVHQQLPALSNRLVAAVQKTIPRTGDWIIQATRRAAPILLKVALGAVGMLGFMALASLMALGAALNDPCLVVVTQDVSFTKKYKLF